MISVGISYYLYIISLFTISINGISGNITNGTAELSSSNNNTYTYNLKRDLLLNYDKLSRPTNDNNTSTVVSIGLAVLHVSLDEASGVFKVVGWIRMVWTDKKLKWNPEKYGNLSSINFVSQEIWIPELQPLNGENFNSLDNYGDTMSLAYPNGEILRVPPISFDVFCSFDFHLWPYDEQKCQMKLGTWNSPDVKITVKESQNEIDRFVENNEWKLLSFTHGVGKDPKMNLDYITYDFVVQRRSPIYKVIIITPASCIILLILSSFWIPPQCGEKIFLNGIIAILISGILLYFSQLLPVLSQNTPLVVLFFSSSLVLVTFSMIISIFLMYMAMSKHQNRLPNFLRSKLNGTIGLLLCLRLNSCGGSNNKRIESDGDKDNQENNDNGDDEQNGEISLSDKVCSIQSEWILLSIAIDRIFFVIYSIIFIVMATQYSV